jgi:hypothetical protein
MTSKLSRLERLGDGANEDYDTKTAAKNVRNYDKPDGVSGFCFHFPRSNPTTVNKPTPIMSNNSGSIGALNLSCPKKTAAFIATPP